jgi:hypothetical protein
MFDFLPRHLSLVAGEISDFCELTGECGVSLFLTLAAVECGGVVTHLLQALRQHVRSLNTTTDDFQRDIGSSPEGEHWVIPLLTLTCQFTSHYTTNQLQTSYNPTFGPHHPCKHNVMYLLMSVSCTKKQ